MGGGDERDESDGEQDDEGGNCGEAGASKWSLGQLKTHFEKEGWDWDGMMVSIEDLLIKTVIAAEPNIVSAWHQGLNFQGAGSIDETFEDAGALQAAEVVGQTRLASSCMASTFLLTSLSSLGFWRSMCRLPCPLPRPLTNG